MCLLDTVPELGTSWEYPAPAVCIAVTHDLNSKQILLPREFLLARDLGNILDHFVLLMLDVRCHCKGGVMSLQRRCDKWR